MLIPCPPFPPWGETTLQPVPCIICISENSLWCTRKLGIFTVHSRTWVSCKGHTVVDACGCLIWWVERPETAGLWFDFLAGSYIFQTCLSPFYGLSTNLVKPAASIYCWTWILLTWNGLPNSYETRLMRCSLCLVFQWLYHSRIKDAHMPHKLRYIWPKVLVV